MKKQLIGGVLLSLFSTLVLAHPGHELSSAYAGFMHPFMGWDHLLMMLAVGVWAAKLVGNLRWQLPLTFVSFMAIGAGLGFLKFQLVGMEAAIASTVIVMGVLLAINLSLLAKVKIALVACFALLHGLAHGVELNGMQSSNALLGMLLATLILHGIGYVAGLQQHQIRRWVDIGLALVMIFTGSLLLVN